MVGKASEFRWIFAIDLGGVPEGLDELGARFTDFRPAWPELASKLGGHLERNWLDAEHPLSERYARRKAREGRGSTPMVRTGAVAAALARGPVLSSQPMSLSVGLRGELAERAAALHFGTAERKSNLPARPAFDWTPPMVAAAEAALEGHIDAAIAAFNGSSGGRPSLGGAA